ncbi:MAG: DUF4830 domain-containing protein [Oscillospiraceae bacterium]|nr:DUF4830 domain-containing protein [Oscillospiraceae bacterium]
MQTRRPVFTRKKALLWVFAAAALLVGLILARTLLSPRWDLSARDGRQQYLSHLGWEIDPETEACKHVRIPEKLEGVIADYNEMQKTQGCDLSRHLGEACEQYTYQITNYPDDSQTVLVTLYIQGRRLIAGDIHSTALDGFMHGLRLE